MITLQYLQLLTKAEKSKWHPPKNRSLLTDFALEQAETTWIVEAWSKTMTEIRGTAPLGKEFADATTGILQRERNWVGGHRVLRQFALKFVCRSVGRMIIVLHLTNHRTHLYLIRAL
jgi:hypothetical protein